MKAIQSYRFNKYKPYFDIIGGIEFMAPALYMLALSAVTIKKYHKNFLFITDNLGKKIAETCNLPYTEIKSVGDSFDSDPSFWIHSKIYTYANTQEPFVHYDNDFFLWEELPESLLSNEVFGFHTETFMWHRYEEFNSNLLKAGFKFPKFTEKYWINRIPINMALFGGNNWKAINEYGKTIEKFIVDNQNFTELSESQKDVLELNLSTIEQLWGSYIIQSKLNIPVGTLITEQEIKNRSGKAKVTHLHGYKQHMQKSNKLPELLLRLETKLNSLDPKVYSAVKKFIYSDTNINTLLAPALIDVLD
jgi:hypothetical protein